ncbi:hypothetical protein FN846DRAFT_885983 [Sphaerosporella brunnea]|uniref:Uncharacterized protein n=1 Tax=Sphaerosporella brunnea TaxID=1250544 RepID=A0A5J5FAU1_9PEZI|nr:hypothetical protein FN846DRAFT_885983 [Sphaerosporella brunnea]
MPGVFILSSRCDMQEVASIASEGHTCTTPVAEYRKTDTQMHKLALVLYIVYFSHEQLASCAIELDDCLVKAIPRPGRPNAVCAPMAASRTSTCTDGISTFLRADDGPGGYDHAVKRRVDEAPEETGYVCEVWRLTVATAIIKLLEQSRIKTFDGQCFQSPGGHGVVLILHPRATAGAVNSPQTFANMCAIAPAESRRTQLAVSS